LIFQDIGQHLSKSIWDKIFCLCTQITDKNKNNKNINDMRN